MKALCLALACAASAAQAALPLSQASTPSSPYHLEQQQQAESHRRLMSLPGGGVGYVDPAQLQIEHSGRILVTLASDLPAMPQSGNGLSLPGVQSLTKVLDRDIELPALPASATGSQRSSRAEAAAAISRLNRLYVVEPQEGAVYAEVMQQLRASPLVEHVEPDFLVKPLAAPSDPWFHYVWGMNNTSQPYQTYWGAMNENGGNVDADMDWLEAWESPNFPTPEQAEIVIAVIDTGVDYTNPDLANQMWVNPGEDLNGDGIVQESEKNFVDDDNNGFIDDFYGIDTRNDDTDPNDDDHYHGTHCAGTIAAQANNGIAMTGVNPYAKIMAVKFLGPNGGSIADAIDAIRYAVDMGADVLSNSWGGGAATQSLQDAITYAHDQGVIFVAAAGNSNTSIPQSPASLNYVLCVGATDSKDGKADFSNYGPWVDVMAPGDEIWSLRSSYIDHPMLAHNEDPNMAILSGTSMACPSVSGLASLLIAKNPGRDTWLYEQIIEITCDDIDSIPSNAGYAGLLGTGRVNVNNALAFNDPAVFLSSYLELGADYGKYALAPGEAVRIFARLGTWAQDYDNLSIHITNITDGLEINGLQSYDVGTLSAYSVLDIKDSSPLSVAVKSNAQYGSTQTLTVELRQGLNGETLLDSQVLSIPIYNATFDKTYLADFDKDGIKEIVAVGSLIFVFNPDQSLKWTVDHSGYVDTQYVTFSQMAIADFDGDGWDECAIVAWDLYFHNTDLIFIDWDDGVNPPDGVGRITKHDNIAYNLSEIGVVDSDRDGTYELLAWGDAGIASYNKDGSTNWTTDEHIGVIGDLFGCGVVVADIEGDPTPEIVTAGNGKRQSSDVAGYLSYEYFDRLEIFNSATGEKIRAFEYINDETIRFADYVDLGDFDADGDLEACFGYAAGGASIIELDSGAIISGENPVAIGGNSSFGAIADLDNDGDLECVALSTSLNTLYANHHDGTPVDGFPVYFDAVGSQTRVYIADVNNDNSPDILYSGPYEKNESEGIESWKIWARDANGLLIQGFPKTITQPYSSLTHPYDYYLQINELAPPFDEDETYGNATIIAQLWGSLHLIDTGFPFNPYDSDKTQTNFDPKLSNLHTYRTPTVEARFRADEKIGFDSNHTATFYPSVYGTLEGDLIAYAWDLDGDGQYDDSTAEIPSHTFGAGDHSVALQVTVTRNAGQPDEEVFSDTHTRADLIHVYPAGLTSDFTADARSGSAPLRSVFTPVWQPGIERYEWDLDGDSLIDSTLPYPSFVYQTVGTYDVSLTVYHHSGESATITKTAYIEVIDAPSFDSSNGGTDWNTRSTGTEAGFNGIAIGPGGQVVAAGTGGAFYTSTDSGATWSPETPDTLRFNCIRQATNRYLIAGNHGHLLVSDPIEDKFLWSPMEQKWNVAPTSTTENLNAVAFAPYDEVIVAVGDNGTVLVSNDFGATVTAIDVSALTTGHLNDVAFGIDKFVAVGDNGIVLVSTDLGQSWTLETSGTTENLNCLVYIASATYDDEVYAFGDNAVRLYASERSEGAFFDWSVITQDYEDTANDYAIVPAANITENFTDCIYTTAGNNYVQIVGDGGRMISYNGSSWMLRTLPVTETTNFTGICFNNFAEDNKYLLVSTDDGRIFKSDYYNGATTWTLVASGSSATYRDLLPVEATNSGVFTTVAVGDSALIEYSTSTMSDQWTNYKRNDVVWTGSDYFMTAECGLIFRSADGSDWSLVNSDTATNLYTLAHNGSGTLVAVGEDMQVTTSADAGATWSGITIAEGLTEDIRDVAWHASGSQFVAVGDSGFTLTSPDGLAWTVHSTAVSDSLRSVATDGTKLVTVGTWGVVLSSSDGANWTQALSGTLLDLNDILWDGAQFVAVGQSGKYMTSADGSLWTHNDIDTNYNLTRVLSDGVNIKLTASGRTLYVDDDGGNIAPYDSPANAAHILQDVIDLAIPGDTILVLPGLYVDNGADINSKNNLTIRSLEGPEATIMSSTETQNVAFGARHSNNLRFEGFTIQNYQSTNATAFSTGLHDVSIRNCIIRNNTTQYWAMGTVGGGTVIYVGIQQGQSNGRVVIEDCEIYNNLTYDGALFMINAKHTEPKLIIKRSQIYGNEQIAVNFTATYPSLLSNSLLGDSISLRNCLIYDNHTTSAYLVGERGPVAATQLSTRIQTHLDNCTLVGNSSLGGIAATRVRNCIIQDTFATDTSYTDPSGIWNTTSLSAVDLGDTITFDDGQHTIHNNIAEGFPTGDDVTNNITQDPLFVDAENHDYRLQATSPGIDAADHWQVSYYEESKKIWLDFGRTDPSPDNANIFSFATLGAGSAANFVTAFDTNAKYLDGTDVPYTVSLDQDMVAEHYNAEVRPLPPEPYPQSIMSDGMGFPEGLTANFTFSGFDPDKYYQFVYGIWTFNAEGDSADHNTTPTLYGKATTTLHLGHGGYNPEFKSLPSGFVRSDSSGDFRLELETIGDSEYGGVYRSAINMLEIIEYTESFYPSPIPFMKDLDGGLRAFDGQADIGCFEYLANLEPVVDFTVSSNDLRSGKSVSFSATASDADGSIASYAWDWNSDGVVDDTSGATPSHTFTTQGIYQVRLTVTDDGGMSASVTHAVEIIPAVPDAVADFAGVINANGADIDLSWSDVSGETGYRIERAVRTTENQIDYIIDDDALGNYFDYQDPGVFDGVAGIYYTEWKSGSHANTYGGDFTFLDSNYVPTAVPGCYFDIYPKVPEAGNYEIYTYLVPKEAFSQLTLPDPQNLHFDEDTYLKFPDPIILDVITGLAHEYPQISYKDTDNGEYGWVKVGEFYLDESSYIWYSTNYNKLGYPVNDAWRYVKIDDFQTLATVSADATSYTDTDIEEGFYYVYRIVAVNDEGDSLPTIISEIQSPWQNEQPVANIDNVTATSGMPPLYIEVTGSATDAEDAPDSLHYKWDFGSGYSGSVKQGVNLTSTHYQYPYPGTFEIKLTVTDSGGRSHTYTYPTVITVEGGAPNAPSQCMALNSGDRQLTISWNDNSINETGFTLQRYNSATEAWENLADMGISETEYVDNGLIYGETYEYRVRSEGLYGSSEWSNTAIQHVTDTQPPYVLNVTTTDATHVRIVFNEKMYVGTAQEATNYTIDNGVSVIQAQRLNIDNYNVVELTTSELTYGQLYTLTINNVTDWWGNEILTDTQATFEFAIIPEGVIAWYGLDSTSGTTAYDKTGGIQGTLYNFTQPTVWTGASNGYVNGALDAAQDDATDGFVKLNSPLPISLASDFTIIAWIKTTDDKGVIIGRGLDSDSTKVEFSLEASNTYLLANVGGVYGRVQNIPINDDTWHMVTLVNDATAGKAYAYLDSGLDDGINDRNREFTPGTHTSSMDTFIGAMRGTTNADVAGDFDGLIDEIRVYDHALTQSEVQELFENTLNDTTAPDAVTGLSVLTAPGENSLSWTNPSNADFVGVLVLKKEGSAVTATPTNGQFYLSGTTLGDAEVLVSSNTNSYLDRYLTNETAYHYAIYAYDANYNYSVVATIIGTPSDSGSITLREGENGYTGMVDTYLNSSSSNVNTNYATAQTLYCRDTRTVLMKWDLSSNPLPQSVILDGVQLQLSITDTGPCDIYAATSAWTVDGATWETLDGTTPWETPGARGSGDVGPLLGSATFSTSGLHSIDFNATGVQYISDILTGAQPNYGFILSSSSSDRVIIESSETGTVDNRPGLMFSFTYDLGNTFDKWIVTQHNLSGNDALAEADPDGDGIVNLLEYAFNLSPQSANARGLPAVAHRSFGQNDYLILTFRKNKEQVGLSYTVESSENLQQWFPRITNETIIDDDVDGDGQTRKVEVRVNYLGAPLYLRLNVSE